MLGALELQGAESVVTFVSRAKDQGEIVGFIPAVVETFPEFGAGSRGRGDAALVELAGFAEFGEEWFALVEGDGGHGAAGAGSDIAIGGDVEGDLEDLGGSTGAAVEGAVAEEGFEGDDRGPGCDEVGVGEDVFGGGLLGFGVLAELDEISEVIGLVRVVTVVDAGDFEGAAAVGFGELVDSDAAFGVAAGFGVDDPGTDAELIGRACGKGGHAGDMVSKAGRVKARTTNAKRPRR
jgi:hypothetical protein